MKKRAEELEQTLQLQLAQLKKDSQTWMAVGGAVLAVALIVTAVAKSSRKKKNKKKYHLQETVQEPVRKVRKRAQSSSLFSPLKKRLFMALFSLGQAKLMEELKRRREKVNEG